MGCGSHPKLPAATSEHASRYQLFDVFAEKLRIESLTKRRLFGDRSIQIKFVDNPLAPFKLQVK